MGFLDNIPKSRPESRYLAIELGVATYICDFDTVPEDQTEASLKAFETTFGLLSVFRNGLAKIFEITNVTDVEPRETEDGNEIPIKLFVWNPKNPIVWFLADDQETGVEN
jgi:hypothetical protein